MRLREPLAQVHDISEFTGGWTNFLLDKAIARLL